MHAFAAYIMRGRSQAMFVTAACGIVSLLIFPFAFPVVFLLGQVSAACVALVTLRRGALDGAIIIAGATLISGGLAAVSASDTNMAVTFLVMYTLAFWWPVWLVGLVLRYTRAMEMALVSASVLGIVIVVSMHLYIGDVTAWWTQLLSKAFEPVLQSSKMSAQEAHRLIEAAAKQMTGSMAAGFMLGVMTSLFLARWWQALLYYPGGFRKEFHAMRLGRQVAIVSVIVAIAGFLPLEKIADVSHDIFIVVIAAYMLHGLSLVHNVVSTLGMHTAWLVVVYLMMLFLPPVRILMAAAGFADSWVDLRTRISPPGSPQGPDGDGQDRE